MLAFEFVNKRPAERPTPIKNMSDEHFAVLMYLKDTNPGNSLTSKYGKAYQHAVDPKWCTAMGKRSTSDLQHRSKSRGGTGRNSSTGGGGGGAASADGRINGTPGGTPGAKRGGKGN